MSNSRAKKSATKPGDQPLQKRQLAFVDQYIIDLNGKQAAIRAGYSPKTAEQQASRLLSNVKVADEVAKRQQERNKRTEITQDRVLQELYRLAFVDIRKFFNDDGSAKQIAELDDDAAAALAGFEIVELNSAPGSPPAGFTKKFKLTEKKGAIELLMRHMGMLNDKMKLQGDPESPLTLLWQQVSGTPMRPAGGGGSE